jgi:hypothetical protein
VGFHYSALRSFQITLGNVISFHDSIPLIIFFHIIDCLAEIPLETHAARYISLSTPFSRLFSFFYRRNESNRVNIQCSEIFQLGDRKSLFDGFYISGMVGGVKNAFCFYCLSSRVGPSQVLELTYKRYAWGGILSGGPGVIPRAEGVEESMGGTSTRSVAQTISDWH